MYLPRISLILFFSVFLSLLTYGQEKDCHKYEESLKKGDAHSHSKNYDVALKSYQDAMIAARECGTPTNVPADRIKKVADILREEKDKAVKLKIEAQSATKKADSLMQDAQKKNQQLELKNKALQSMALSNIAYIEIYKNENFTKGFRYAQYALCNDTNNSSARNAIYATIYEPLGKPKHLFSKLTLPNIGNIKYLVFPDSGKKMLTLTNNGEAKIWGTDSGILFIDINSGGSDYYSAGLSLPYPDNQKILTQSGNNIKTWDPHSGRILENRSLDVIANCTDAVFVPGTKSLLSLNGSDVEVWNTDTWKVITRISINSTSPVFSPDGRKILLLDTQPPKILDALTGRLTDTLSNADKLHFAIFSPDSKYLIMSFSDSTAKLYDIERKTDSISRLNLGSSMKTCAFSPGGKTIVATFNDESIMSIGLNDLVPIDVYKTNATFAAFSPDGRMIITTNKNMIKLWDLGKPYVEKVTLSGHSDMISRAGFTPDAKKVWAIAIDDVLKMWNIETVNEKGTWRGPWENASFSTISPNLEQILVIAGNKGKIYDLNTNEELVTLSGYFDSGSILFYSPDGKKLIKTIARDSLKIWNAQNGRVIGIIKRLAKCDSFFFSPDCNKYCEIRKDTILLADIEKATRSQYITATSLLRAFFSPNGKSIITSQKNGKLSLWNTSDGKEIKVFDKERSAKYTFSSDRTKLLKVYNNVATIFKVGDDNLIEISKIDTVKEATFSADKNILFTRSEDSKVKIYDIQKHSILNQLANGDVSIAILSPDKKFALIPFTYGRAAICRSDTISDNISEIEGYKKAYFSNDSRLLLTINGNECTLMESNNPDHSISIPDVKEATLSRDGKLLLTRYYNTFKLWDTKSFEEIITLPIGEPKKYFFSPDSKRILAEYKDGTSRVWLLDPFELIANIIRRNKIDDLSDAEKQKAGIQ